MILSSQLPPQSKLIIVPSSEKWKTENKEKFQQFLMFWKAHQVELKTEFFELNDFLVAVAINEDYNAASGCSLDSFTRFLKELEPQQAGLFNRFNVYILMNGQVKISNIDELKEMYRNQMINENTLFFDTLINQLKNIENDLLKPISHSWFWKQLI